MCCLKQVEQALPLPLEKRKKNTKMFAFCTVCEDLDLPLPCTHGLSSFFFPLLFTHAQNTRQLTEPFLYSRLTRTHAHTQKKKRRKEKLMTLSFYRFCFFATVLLIMLVFFFFFAEARCIFYFYCSYICVCVRAYAWCFLICCCCWFDTPSLLILRLPLRRVLALLHGGALPNKHSSPEAKKKKN